MKKGIFAGIFGTLSGILMTGLASAQYGYGYLDMGYLTQRVIEIWQSIFIPILSTLFGTYYGDTYLFTKFLILILLFVVIRVILLQIDMFKSNKTIVWIVAGVISLIAVRYMSELQVIQGVLIPTGALGVALMTILPFLLFFYFIQKSGMAAPGRRLSWIIFGICFLAIWLTRDNLPSVLNQIYLWTFVAIVLALIFDRSIHTYFELWHIKRMERTIEDKIILELLEDLETAEKHSDTEEGKRQIERIKKQLREKKVGGFD